MADSHSLDSDLNKLMHSLGKMVSARSDADTSHAACQTQSCQALGKCLATAQRSGSGDCQIALVPLTCKKPTHLTQS